MKERHQHCCKRAGKLCLWKLTPGRHIYCLCYIALTGWYGITQSMYYQELKSLGHNGLVQSKTPNKIKAVKCSCGPMCPFLVIPALKKCNPITESIHIIHKTYSALDFGRFHHPLAAFAMPSAFAWLKCFMTNSYVSMVVVAAGTALIILVPIPA